MFLEIFAIKIALKINLKNLIVTRIKNSRRGVRDISNSR